MRSLNIRKARYMDMTIYVAFQASNSSALYQREYVFKTENSTRCISNMLYRYRYNLIMNEKVICVTECLAQLSTFR